MARGTLAQNYEITEPMLYEDFATIGDWTAGGSAGSTATADLENLDGYAAALKLDVVSTTGGNAFATKTISTNFDTDKIFRMRFRIYVADPTTVSSVAIYISSSTTLATFFLSTVSAGFSIGWNTLTLHRDSFTASGGEVWSNTMVRIRVRLNAVAATLPKVTFASLKTGGRNNANILFTFDDAFDDVYIDAFPYMSARGIVGTVYINWSLIGTSGYCTLAEILEMQDAGWAMANHVYSHTNLTTVDEATQRSLVQQNIDAAIANGCPVGVDHLAYPNGGHNAAIIALIESMGIKTARTVNEWTGRGQSTPVESLHKLRVGNCLDTVAASTVIEWMATAYKTGSTLILLYHKLPATATISTEHDLASFQAEVVEAQRLKSMGLMTDRTIVDWHRGLTNPRG